MAAIRALVIAGALLSVLGLWNPLATSGLVRVAARGESPPDGNGTFFGSFPSPALINAAGEVAFFASLSGTREGAADNEGIFLFDGVRLIQIARKGQPAPDGNGTFLSFDTSQIQRERAPRAGAVWEEPCG